MIKTRTQIQYMGFETWILEVSISSRSISTELACVEVEVRKWKKKKKPCIRYGMYMMDEGPSIISKTAIIRDSFVYAQSERSRG